MNRSRILAAVLLFLGLLGLAPAGHALDNQLKSHPSPYLALHGADPVAWQDWNEAAVALARKQNKLVFLSIGYFSCHWCHVMQRESYQNAEIARFINAHFIPVKVDRELDPALDARMLEFAEATRGMGGWPLNVFVTPDGHPLYATLYLPPQEFLAVLERLDVLWTSDRDKLMALAHQAEAKPKGPGKPALAPARVQAYAKQLVAEALARADLLQGGFNDQTKFPLAPQLDFLLAHQARSPDPKLEEFLQLTLDQMAANGLHDHLGGGFFRYTVDPGWKTPHFEKMLYDNAQLARLYLRAARVFKREHYARVAARTLDFMTTTLRDPSGAFIAALSALDDKGVEGGYYLWHAEELDTLLSVDERAAYRLAWGMQDAPPFEAGYLPIPSLAIGEIAERLQRPRAETEKLLTDAAGKLRAARAQRGLPRDTKLIAAWNGLALAAFSEAARVTGDESYRATARAVRDYIMKQLWDGEALRRSRAADKTLGKVALEDYAYVASGLLEWAELTGEPADYAQAKAVTMQAWRRFYGARGWRLEERSLIQAETGQDMLTDGPMPSPSGVVAEVSLRLAAKTGDKALRERALAALNTHQAALQESAFWYATPVGAMMFGISR
ncbi:MAG: thioredoxin domain-containing protein [Gammaproteobacteria bacterium]|nr:thioredoxin domain-containing protein [Gammaproteobacteria bacterium]